MEYLRKAEKHIDTLQDVLEFRETRLGPHFEGKTGLGRFGFAGAVLGAVFGLHLAGGIGFSILLPLIGIQGPYGILNILVSRFY